MGGKTKHFTVSGRVADPDQDCEMTDLPPELAAFASLLDAQPESAWAAFGYGDIHRLDGDNDGKACEALR